MVYLPEEKGANRRNVLLEFRATLTLRPQISPPFKFLFRPQIRHPYLTSIPHNSPHLA